MIKKVLCSVLTISVLLFAIPILSTATDSIDTVSLKKELVQKAPKVRILDESEKDKFSDEVSKGYAELLAKKGYNVQEIEKYFKSKGFIKFDAKKA